MKKKTGARGQHEHDYVMSTVCYICVRLPRYAACQRCSVAGFFFLASGVAWQGVSVSVSWQRHPSLLTRDAACFLDI
jgi:hypothetical protein